MSTQEVIYKKLSYKIVGILFDVYNELGYGYQEKYYERAVDRYLIEARLKYKRQAPYNIMCKGEIIGKYYIDFIIEDKIILEIKKGNYFSRRNIQQVKGLFAGDKYEISYIS